MVTFFSIPKKFEGLYETIQTNAILSWIESVPNCEIILFIDDSEKGKLKFNQENVIIVDDNKTNNYGTPLLSYIWTKAYELSSNNHLCFINSDIIIFPEFNRILNIGISSYLIAGRRWDLDFKELVKFESNWDNNLIKKAKSEGLLHQETGVDYFLFTKNSMPKMPNFAIGRGWWDNWLLYNFGKRGIPVIDGTELITVHQNHDYSHIKSVTKETNHKGLERIENGKIANLSYYNIIYISDSKYFLCNNEIIKRPFFYRLKRLLIRYGVRTFSKFIQKLKF
ncbi:MAG: hypothetical protein CMM02_06330 [Rhodopirellula sp.]|nr:hypothetical protein [Rhodopirellula sp.]|tara:strand:- start:285 stop:1127 length:843 start_codon:yes stop_codon:yes gene_type:complete